MFVLLLSFLLGGFVSRARMALRGCSLIKAGHGDSRISQKTAGLSRCREGRKSYEEIEACSLSKDKRL